MTAGVIGGTWSFAGAITGGLGAVLAARGCYDENPASYGYDSFGLPSRFVKYGVPVWPSYSLMMIPGQEDSMI